MNWVTGFRMRDSSCEQWHISHRVGNRRGLKFFQSQIKLIPNLKGQYPYFVILTRISYPETLSLHQNLSLTLILKI